MRYAGRSFSPVRFLVLRLVLSAVLLSRLPLVVALGLWPDKEIRRAWHGAWRAYLKLLGEVISLREGPAQLECR
jgi:hypothetical protein